MQRLELTLLHCYIVTLLQGGVCVTTCNNEFHWFHEFQGGGTRVTAETAETLKLLKLTTKNLVIFNFRLFTFFPIFAANLDDYEI